MRTYEVAGERSKKKTGQLFDVIQDNNNFFSFMKHWHADEVGYMTAIHIINKKTENM